MQPVYPILSPSFPSRGLALFRQLAAALCLALVAFPASAANIIHEFYVPLPEAQVKTALTAIEPAAGIVGNTLDSVISIVVTGSGTVVHYDQWEDGYEVDLNNPSQSTTKIWGDGNDANGIPPGYTHDPASFTPGSVIVLRNLVALPRNPATLLYDGRDRFGGTKALVVSRASWATTPGTVLAGANEVQATMDYGTNFIAPVGDDVSAASMFEYVGMFVMARDDATSVTLDPDGPGSTVGTTFVLNRGESYLFNGGIKKGATVVASKPVQVDLITGDIGARYESRRFTLYARDQWSNTTYSPVGTAANSSASFAFLYNPNASSITVNATTCLGNTALTVPANGVVQWQLAKSCGAKFATAGGEDFFGIVCVGANPSANNVNDWGFSMVPSDNLTSQAVVGWGPGSSDLTQNGSPVWVTPTKATRVYVDYNGDGLGSIPVPAPTGGFCDATLDIGALETRTVYDPDKDGTAMKLFTNDGTTIAVAWGQDPAVAGPALPFLDCGTTVLPFPVPVLKKTAGLYTDTAPTGMSVGDTIEYTVTVDNKGLLPLGNLIVLDPLNAALAYIANSTTRDGTAIADSSTGTPFPLDESGYSIPIILRGGTTVLKYRCTIIAAGTIQNVVNNITYNLNSDATVTVPTGGGSTPCAIAFTNSTGGAPSYTTGSSVYATLTDLDANTSATTIQTASATITNAATGDAEIITLTETGVNTGIFRNVTGLPTSTSSGSSTMDGTLLVVAGNTITVSHLDTVFGETCTNTATVSLAAQTKILYLNTDGSDNDTAGALDRVDPVATSDGSTSSTSALGLAFATITVDATSQGGSASASSLTIPHTTGTGSNRLMLVGVTVGSSSSTGSDVTTVSSVSYGTTPGSAVALTSVGTVTDPGTRVRSHIFKLVNPVSGAANVYVNTAAARPLYAGVTTFAGVDQTTPLGSYQSASVGNAGAGGGGVTSHTFAATSASGELLYDCLALDGETTAYTATVGASQTSRWTRNTSNSLFAGGSTAAGAAIVNLAWTWSPADPQQYGYSVVSIKPASAGGSPTATFTQAPGFASTFTMPAASAPSVSAYYTVATGSMPATPNITAELKKNGTTFATSTSASAASGLLTFNFGALSSAQTFAATDVMSLVVTTAQGGVTFKLDYDSSTSASKITLPTTTVITTGAPVVYDAPYPGGSPITALIAGSTAYVRTTASDPFGFYDITSLGITIANSTPTTIVNTTASVVGTPVGASKTFEYAWAVPSTTGTYTITTQANEGTEGINARSSTTVGVTQLDLGTPSVTEFTTGSNGSGTPTYTGDEQVCVRITDVDQNTNAAVADTITAVLTATSGDSELITLTETGINTGIFAYCIPASTTGGTGNNSGTLHAVLGDVLHVVYVDPTDTTDTSDDTATIPNIAPAISVTKTLVTPADGICVVGDPVSFTLQITNTGNTTLTTVSPVDTFDNTKLTYLSANLTPDVIQPTHIDWTNVGPLSPGQSTTISVNFTALAAATPTTNSVAVSATGGVNASHTANVTITNPHITIAKTLLSASPANVGDNVVFRIVATNDGSSAIASLPIEDTFSGANFEFVSATLTPDASGAGSLLWLDATGAGNLAPAASITIDVTLKAKGAAAPATNLAAANYTVDVNGDSAPPVQSSTTVTLVAATISGKVYDDLAGDGGFTSGDPGLEGITVKLYTDPNGDGDPSDGTLVAIATTDANGAYEFPNLSAQKYTIVESDPPGYASTGDTSAPNDNRIPVNVTTLTAFTGRDFFDQLPPPISYGSVSGTVFNDANADGSHSGDSGLANVGIDLVQDTNQNGIADPGEPIINSTLTDSSGNYSFSTLTVGFYVVVEHDLYGWISTNDNTIPNDNQIGFQINTGDNLSGCNFLDAQTGTVSGSIRRDTNNDNVGDVAQSGLTVALFTDPNADGDPADGVQFGSSTTTDSSGNYSFTLVPPGSYVVVQTPATGTVPAIDGDTTTLGDDATNTNTKDNRIPVAITPGETDDGNNFVNVNTVAFGNLVFNDVNNNGHFDVGTDSGIDGVTLQLWSPGTDTIAGTSDDTQADDPNTVGLQNYVVTTSGGGLYSFSGIAPGSYYIKVAASNFGSGAPLEDKLSAVASAAGDDDVGEDGIDNGAPSVNGIRSAVFNTLPGVQPTDANTETGFGKTADNANDADANLTIDFGFTTPVGCINQIVNGSFEIDREPARWTGTDSFVDANNATRLNVTSDNAPAGWTLLNQQAGSGGNTQSYWIQDAARAVDGQRFVYMQADQAVATQTFCLNGYVPLKTSGACEADFVEGKTYRISFDYAMFDTAQPNGNANDTHELWIESAYYGGAGLLYPPEAPTNGELLRVSAPLSSWGSIQWKHAEIYITPPVGSGRTYFDLAISSPPDGTKGVLYDNVKFEGLCCEVGVGNVVFKDANNSGDYDPGEGVSGAKLQLFNSNDTAVDDPHQFGTQPYEVTTASDGSYEFNGLQPGSYYIKVPAGEFASGKPLYGLYALSSVVAGDDDAGQDGIFNASPATNGIRTATFALAVNTEPTDATTETGFANTSDNSDDDNTNLTIDLGYACPTITVAPAVLTAAVVGTSYSVALSASGGTGSYTYSVTGTLPDGLSLISGVIAGIPTSTTSRSFTITATDAVGCSGSIGYTLAPTCPLITLASTPSTLLNGTVGSSYSASISATGGTPSYDYTLDSGSLPLGLTLHTTGVIDGTPLGPVGGYSFTVKATDAHGCAGIASFTIGIDCNVLAITPNSISNGTVGTTYGPVTFSAGGATGGVIWSVVSGTLPSGLTLTGNSLGGTPNSAGSSSFAIKAIDANGCIGTVNLSVTMNCPAITVNPITLAAATVNTPYTQSITATNGTAPYTFTTAQTLPADLILDSDGTLHGTPTSTTSRTFTVVATDAHNCTGSLQFTLQPGCPSIAVAGPLPNGTVNTAYSASVTASGGITPYSFTTSDTLPAGLALDSNGTLHGTPTSTTSRTFTVVATDANLCTGSLAFTVAPACPTITLAGPLPNGTVNASYSANITASGGIGSYSFTTGDMLPAGLALDTNGHLHGTPTSTTSRTFTVTATDTNNCTGTLAFTVAPACPTITVAGPLPNGTVNTSYSASVSASGGIAPYSFTTGDILPAGLTLDTNGTLHGIPTSTTPRIIIVTAKDANNCTGEASFTLTPACPTITLASLPAVLPNATNSVPYSANITASGGTASYSYAITAGALPANLTLSTTGVISGIPNVTSGSYNFTVTVTDANACTASNVFTISVDCPTITISPSTLTPGVVGSVYTDVTFTTSGSTGVITWQQTGTIPTGMSFTNGVLSGTPNAAGTSNFSLVATDENGCGTSANFTLIVNCPAISVSPNTLPAATVNTAYSQVITATGGTAPYTFTTAQTLPADLTLDSDGTLHGTPTSTTSRTFTVVATDAHNCTGSRSFTVQPACPSIAVNGPIPNGVVNANYTATVTATGGIAPYTFTTNNTLPTGLTLASNGSITGIPTSTISRTITVTATDANLCTGSADFIIAPACPTISVVGPLPNGVVNTSYSASVTASGGIAPYAFTTGDTLPTGLTLTANGTLSGIPTSTTSRTINVTATDANNCTGVAQFIIAPACPTISVTGTLPNGTVNTPYSASVSASGGITPYSFTSPDTLPTGLTLDTDGTLHGLPTSTTSRTIHITATDANNCTGVATFVITPACPTLSITGTLPNGVVGSAYDSTLGATGGITPYSFTTSDALPSGLTLETSGQLHGTITTDVPRTFIVTVTDSNLCTGTRSFTVAPVCPSIVLSSSPALLPAATNGTAYTASIVASGGTGPYNYDITNGALPADLVIDTDGHITGVPNAASGSYSFTVEAIDIHGCSASSVFTISVGCPTITIAPATLTPGIVGSAYTAVTFTTTGANGTVTWQQTGTLPFGMTFSNGTLSGTPTAAGTSNFSLIITDQNGCGASANLSLVVNCPSITVNPASLAPATVNTAYSAAISATGGNAPYIFNTGDTLPTGLTLDSDGTLHGIPTSVISRTFTVIATDTLNCTGSRTFTVQPACPTIAVVGPLPNGTVNTNYSATVTATNGIAPYSFTTGDALPTGLTLASNGSITGIPTSTTATTIHITATDANLCTGIATFTIAPACPTISIAPATLPDVVVATSYSRTLSASGGIAPYTYAVTDGALPDGLTLTDDTIAGIPTTLGLSEFTITVTDANACTATIDYSIDVLCPTLTVSPTTLPYATVYTPYSQAINVSGGLAPYGNFAVTSGSLPSSLTLAANGTISGIPTTPSSNTFTVTFTDARGCAGSAIMTLVSHAATLHGHVYQDTDGNGQQDNGEPDLHDVTVNIGSRTAVTGPSGNWTIFVAPGSVVVDVDETDLDFIAQMTTHFQHLEGDDPETVTAVLDQSTNLGNDGYVPLALVTGHLYFDTDHDGHYQSGEPNLAGVDIHILDANADASTVTTDSAGIWSTYLLPGESIASVDTLDSSFTNILGAGYVHSEGDDPTTFIVSPGATNNGGNDGYYYTAPVIHGHAYRDTNGNAQQDSGEPSLATVDVLINNDDTGFNTIVQTDANGDWSATVEQGSTRIFVNVNDVDFVSLVPGTTYIQTVGANNNVVQPLANQNIDAGTDAFYIPATIKGHLYIDVNGNHTQDNGEVDLRNVDVLITPSTGPAFTVTTDNDGIWTASVPPGSTTANVNELDSDFATNVPSNYILTEGTDPLTVTAVANQTTDLGNNGYFNPGTLHGHLYLDTNGNGAQNNGEPNLASVDVIITDANNEPHTVSTNANGDWTIDIRPGSATIEVQTTDPQFPVGVVQSEGTDPNTATVVINVSTDGGTDGYKPVIGTHSISGQVRDDFDADGSFSDNDTPVSGVTIKLWLDTNNDGALDGNDALVISSTTNSNGQYTFTGLSDGHYLVQEIDPRPSSSTADAEGSPDDNLISVTIAGADIVARDFLDAVDPHGYIYDSVTGIIIPGGSISASGPGAITLLMNGSTGQYSFITDGTPGTYLITFTPPPGYRVDPNRPAQLGSFDPTGLGDPHSMGSAEDSGNAGHLVDSSAPANPYYLSFDLAAGDPLVINNNLPVVLIKPDTYSYWKSITLGAGTTPTSNNDCDAYNDLLEYALCGNATTAVQTTPLFTVQLNGSTGHFDAVFKRPVATSDVTYDLQVISTLADSPAGWVSSGITPVIVNNNDGSETLTYTGLDISAPVNGQTTAFARLKVTQTGAPNASSTTDTFGWTYRTAPTICETFSMPYLKNAIFSGCIDSVTGNIVNVSTSAGSVSVKAQMVGGQSYFIEVISGANEGQRWEVDETASTATSIAIDLSSSLNTKATLPVNLATDVITLRPHWQLGELFDKNAFHGTNSALTADRLLFFDASSQTFTIKWLAQSVVHHWVNTADANLTDQANYIIDNGMGFFVHPRGGPVSLLFSGWVRTNAFARPIAQGNNFVGGGWPVAQSPASRAMSVAGGFTGARSALASDLMQFWAGDTSLLGVGYQSHYLLETATRHQWTPQVNASVLNENNLPLFTPLRAFLLKSIAGKPDYLMPRAWTP